MQMNDEQFKVVCAGLGDSIMGLITQMGVKGDDVTAIASNALLHVLGQRLGLPGAIERLRTLADIVERQALDELGQH